MPFKRYIKSEMGDRHMHFITTMFDKHFLYLNVCFVLHILLAKNHFDRLPLRAVSAGKKEWADTENCLL